LHSVLYGVFMVDLTHLAHPQSFARFQPPMLLVSPTPVLAPPPAWSATVFGNALIDRVGAVARLPWTHRLHGSTVHQNINGTREEHYGNEILRPDCAAFSSCIKRRVISTLNDHSGDILRFCFNGILGWLWYAAIERANGHLTWRRQSKRTRDESARLLPPFYGGFGCRTVTPRWSVGLRAGLVPRAEQLLRLCVMDYCPSGRWGPALGCKPGLNHPLKCQCESSQNAVACREWWMRSIR